MNWESEIYGFKNFLKLEKALSENSVAAYITDIQKLAEFILLEKLEIMPDQVETDHLKNFILYIIAPYSSLLRVKILTNNTGSGKDATFRNDLDEN